MILLLINSALYILYIFRVQRYDLFLKVSLYYVSQTCDIILFCANLKNIHTLFAKKCKTLTLLARTSATVRSRVLWWDNCCWKATVCSSAGRNRLRV